MFSLRQDRGVPTSMTPIRRETPAAMNSLSHLSSMPGRPAASVIVATRLAKTPLALADAAAPGAPILFANDAFGALLGRDPAALAGRSLSTLSTPPHTDISPGGTLRMDIETADGRVFPAALSIAAVQGAAGAPLCLLCSLIDARGEGADEAIARDAKLLAQVAQAAGDLMKESGIAAGAVPAGDHDEAATRIAREAVERAVGNDGRAPR
jgi:hypothetical protein